MFNNANDNIATLSLSAWSGVFITDIDSDTVTVRYGYLSNDGMVYRRRTTRPLEYDYKPEWSEEYIPSFTYYGDRYYIDDFMRI